MKERYWSWQTLANIPQGYAFAHEYDGRRYYRGDKFVVVTGEPPLDEEFPDSHNCDEMGCGWEHVLDRIPIAGVHPGGF